MLSGYKFASETEHGREQRGMEGMYPLQYFNRGMLCVISPNLSFVDFVVRVLTIKKTINRMGFKQRFYCHSYLYTVHAFCSYGRIDGHLSMAHYQ